MYEVVWGGNQPQTWLNAIISTPQVNLNSQIRGQLGWCNGRMFGCTHARLRLILGQNSRNFFYFGVTGFFPWVIMVRWCTPSSVVRGFEMILVGRHPPCNHSSPQDWWNFKPNLGLSQSYICYDTFLWVMSSKSTVLNACRPRWCWNEANITTMTPVRVAIMLLYVN